MRGYLFFSIFFIFIFGNATFAEVINHKGMDIENKKKCDTECHTPENVKKANEDKLTVSGCKDCHVGPDEPDSGNTTSKNHIHPQYEDDESFKNMVLIPAGSFRMGSDERWDDEGPQYTVFLNEFYIDKYEVSNADYKKFVDKTGHKPPIHWRQSVYLSEKKDHPVVYVNWDDANDFCNWNGKRLPTEEEWEKAARGTDGRKYPWGNEFDPAKSNNPLKNSKGTEPVNSYASGKSPYGLYNMSGNVWEWTSSWYKPYPDNDKPRDNYGETHKVLKGGSWYNCHSYSCGISALVYNRAAFETDVKGNSFGFRCVKDL